MIWRIKMAWLVSLDGPGEISATLNHLMFHHFKHKYFLKMQRLERDTEREQEPTGPVQKHQAFFLRLPSFCTSSGHTLYIPESTPSGSPYKTCKDAYGAVEKNPTALFCLQQRKASSRGKLLFQIQKSLCFWRKSFSTGRKRCGRCRIHKVGCH